MNLSYWVTALYSCGTRNEINIFQYSMGFVLSIVRHTWNPLRVLEVIFSPKSILGGLLFPRCSLWA